MALDLYISYFSIILLSLNLSFIIFTIVSSVLLVSISGPFLPRPVLERHPAMMQLTLPRPQKRKRTLVLKPTNSYIFASIYLLYNREVIDNNYNIMTIRCTFSGYSIFKPKIISRTLNSTNNYKDHYLKKHPGIPLTKVKAKTVEIIK